MYQTPPNTLLKPTPYRIVVAGSTWLARAGFRLRHFQVSVGAAELAVRRYKKI